MPNGGKAMGKLHGVPKLPPHYLPRETELSALKQKLLAGDASVGVHGMGGIGKTVLAAALARDSEVRRAFADGIYWLTVGQSPNLRASQRGKDAMREPPAGRRALMILDDVWTIQDADDFWVDAPPARLLITTRNKEVVVGVGAQEHRVDVLSSSEAAEILSEWTGLKSPDKLPPEAAEVAKKCGYLPLALAMIGAVVRLSSRPTAWKDALTRLKRSDLAMIKRAFPGYPYPHLLRAIEASIEALEQTDREHYLDMAIFAEDQPIPEEALRVLWNLDEVDTRECMTRLVARSLGTWATGETSLILHDLQRDLIRKRREKDLSNLHLRLVEGWDALPKLPDDYAWRWIAYHLVGADRKDDLRRLLLNFCYLEAKFTATDANAVATDYDYFPEAEGFRLIQSAIRLSAHVLDRDVRQLAGQLTGRLLGNTNRDIHTLVNQAAKWIPRPWLRSLRRSLAAAGGPLLCTLEGHTDSVQAVAVTIDGRRAISASTDATLRLWDLKTGQPQRTLRGHTGSVWAVALTPDGYRAVSASTDTTLRLWDLGTGQTIRTLKGHTDRVDAVAVMTDGRRAISGSRDQTLRLWDLESGQIIRTLEGHRSFVQAVAVTADGRRAVSASTETTLRLWDLGTGQTIHTLNGHSKFVWAVAVTADRRRAVSASEDRTLRLWDLETGETIRLLEGHTNSVNAVAMTADGRHAVSASEDRTLRLWDLEAGQTIRTLEGHTDAVNAVALMADGRHAVSASEDRTLRLWDLDAGQTKDHTDWVWA